MEKNVLLEKGKNQEQRKLDEISKWYSNKNWGFYTKIVELSYRSIKPFFQPGNVLEIGPADGEMTRMLVTDFDQITVVDAAKKYVDKVIKLNPKITGYTSLIEDFDTDKRFDIIIMSHLLEHLQKPIKVLEKVKNFLKPAGRLIIIVPNANSLHRQVGVKMGLLQKTAQLNDADISVDHKRVYTRALLRKHILKAGLNIKSMGGIMLKPLSNQQIEKQWTIEQIEAFYQLGKDYPALCSELYIVCTKDR